MDTDTAIKQEYLVKVKDFQQNITHSFHEWSYSQVEANAQALAYLRKYFHHSDFEIV